MMKFSSGSKKEEKCRVTYGVMGHLNPKQPPTSRKPFSAILSHKFIQKVELIIPGESYAKIEETLLTEGPQPKYSRVILRLEEILEGEFFNEYIKKGSVLMISEGKVGSENTYSLIEGKLSLHLDRERYEKAGIVGKPDGIKGNRGSKPRWVVEVDLRMPSMQRGKKGFDRILYAFKNVLNTPVTWLFCDLEAASPTPDPLDKKFPVRRTIAPEITNDITAAMPALTPTSEADLENDGEFQDYAFDIYEWFSLVLLKSPCVDDGKTIDPALSRYSPPGNTQATKLVKISWQGLITPIWAHKLFVKIIHAISRDAWFTINISGFPAGLADERCSCMILKLPNANQEYLLWEI